MRQDFNALLNVKFRNVHACRHHLIFMNVESKLVIICSDLGLYSLKSISSQKLGYEIESNSFVAGDCF